MDNNQKRFVSDTLDLLNELDEGLMQLEANPQATAPLEQVFRTMHTVKGAANMFGFNHIGTLAHHLETLYDLVRMGKWQVSDALISITLQAFDKVRDLLKESTAENINNEEALQEHIENAIAFLKNIESQDTSGFVNAMSKDEMATFVLTVSPTIDITPNGTHPLVFIIQDIQDLGAHKTIIKLKENGFIEHWIIIIATATNSAEIESNFIFVDQECKIDLQRLGSGNLIEVEDFYNFLVPFEHAEITLEQLKEIASGFGKASDSAHDEAPEVSLSSIAKNKKNRNDTIIKVSKHKVDDLLNWISELIILQSQLNSVSHEIMDVRLRDVTEQLETITARLRDTSLEIGLVPIESLVTKFKRLVRDLSKSLNKKVNFISEGADTEMDKDVIELMSEPMIHIIRNAIDHGLETPAERKAQGKSEYGTVRLKAFSSSNYVHIIISDDGKGISKDDVFKKAIEKGFISADAEMSEEEILNLIFHSGLSTASKISDVSGRGVGMDVVRQKIHDLRGHISVKSILGAGTSIQIRLPLSRSIIEGLLVRVGETRYVIPMNVVERVERIPHQELNLENRVNPLVKVNEELLSVFSIRKAFHADSEPPAFSDIILVSINGVRKGIAVDRIEDKMQTVMKPLGDAYQQQDFIAGSTILGNGSLALVIDPSRLFLLHQN